MDIKLSERNRLAWPHRRRGLASKAYGMRAHGAASATGFEALRKPRLELVWGSFRIAAAALKPPTRSGYITPKASTSLFGFFAFQVHTQPTHVVAGYAG